MPVTGFIGLYLIFPHENDFSCLCSGRTMPLSWPFSPYQSFFFGVPSFPVKNPDKAYHVPGPITTLSKEPKPS